MKLRFAKYGVINALWSLIPIIPILTLIPGVMVATALEKLTNDCETSYRLVLWASVLSVISLTVIYTSRLDKIALRAENEIKDSFRYWCFALYTLTNTAGLIILVGVNLACRGDGQTILAGILSGPIASLVLVIFGLIVDIKAAVAKVSWQ